MRPTRLVLLTFFSMVAFAGNSLLCRLALRQGEIGAAGFTLLRLASGAAMLCALAWWRRRRLPREGSWLSALALFTYAAAFSFAYLSLSAATGALLLFGTVQILMIGHGLRRGERLHGRQWLGLALACGGLVILLLPGLSAPAPLGAALMVLSGAGWAAYSLRGSLCGRGAGDPALVSAGNFLRAVPAALLLGLACAGRESATAAGIAYALASGAVASGLGYALWYAALPALGASSAATVQLSVPVLTALGGALLLGEAFTPRLALASAAVLGGIALVILRRSAHRGR